MARNSLTQYLGECWLNTGLAYLILKNILGIKRKPSHCGGITRCLSVAKKMLTMPGSLKIKLLVVDYEKAPEHSLMLGEFIKNFNCTNTCQDIGASSKSSFHINVYLCRDDLLLVTLRGSPEDVLSELDPGFRRHLSNPRIKRMFKNYKIYSEALGISDKLGINTDCNEFASIIHRGLCILYKEVAKAINRCSS